ncbi:homoserine kinase [Methylobacterium goesingense]|uniref:Homoserine kinase n=1 Tax=Methylobacterium goesingense TaxID=243690 RepID=A0ABV2L4R7_9HYPH|nr:homoserine kinase [Methylobacterium goesingense]GJD72836.1 Homoserine kinase [Methylobacterium goesingense]
MAVYTEVSDEALTAFLSAYEIGTLLSYKGIAEGVENTNFFLHTTAGSYILTLYEKRVRVGDLPFFLNLMEHLAARGLACPQPIRNRAGVSLSELCGRPAVIVSFLEGVSVKRPGIDHCWALGGALAGLHAAGADFGMRRDNNLSVESWGPLFAGAEAQADTVSPGLADRVRGDLAVLQAGWPAGLPTGVIHADLFTDNVFFIGDALSGLIDFYFACTDAFAYDLAICLNAWCFEADGTFDRDKGAALIAGYEAVRRLTAAEVEALPILCRGAALRFLLTRLVDWLDVPPGALVQPKDPLEYDRRLTFHRTAMQAVDYGWGV